MPCCVILSLAGRSAALGVYSRFSSMDSAMQPQQDRLIADLPPDSHRAYRQWQDSARRPLATTRWRQSAMGLRRWRAPAAGPAGPPLSFVYDGKPSAELLTAWRQHGEVQELDEQRTRHLRSWTDAASGLVVRCEAIEYHDFPAVGGS